MASARSRTRLSAPLILVCGLLGFTLYLSDSADPPIPPAPTIGPGSTVAQVVTATAPVRDYSLAPIGSYGETVQRPIFSETRRPPEPEPDAPAPEPAKAEPPASPKAPPKPGLVVSGIIISSTGRFALVQVAGTGTLMRLSVGEEIGGWDVVQIEANRIVLRHGETSEVYELKDRTPAGKRPPAQRSERLQQPAPPPPQPAANATNRRQRTDQ